MAHIMLESKWTADLRHDLELAGAVVVPHVASGHASGWPDRIVWHPLWRGWCEFKGPSTPVSKRQAMNMSTLWRRRPGTAVVLRYPGVCEDPQGEKLFDFTTAKGLLQMLAALEHNLNLVNATTPSLKECVEQILRHFDISPCATTESGMTAFDMMKQTIDGALDAMEDLGMNPEKS